MSPFFTPIVPSVPPLLSRPHKCIGLWLNCTLHPIMQLPFESYRMFCALNVFSSLCPPCFQFVYIGGMYRIAPMSIANICSSCIGYIGTGDGLDDYNGCQAPCNR